MKITKDYLRSIIKEEIEKMDEFDFKGMVKETNEMHPLLKLDQVENHNNGNGDLEIQEEVTLYDGRGRTIKPGLYKLKTSWDAPDTHWGVYTWMKLDQHLGDISIEEVKKLIGAKKAVAHAPRRRR